VSLFLTTVLGLWCDYVLMLVSYIRLLRESPVDKTSISPSVKYAEVYAVVGLTNLPTIRGMYCGHNAFSLYIEVE
jgi:hypothetical protein